MKLSIETKDGVKGSFLAGDVAEWKVFAQMDTLKAGTWKFGVRVRAMIVGLALAAVLFSPVAQADETCSSPYLARIEGQEEFLYTWTLGVEGLGDGSDKL